MAQLHIHPIDSRLKINEIYENTYDWLKTSYPSLFIRSYVYVIFIKIRGIDGLDLDMKDEALKPTKNDFQIYVWNTNYDIKLSGKMDLFNLRNAKKDSDGSAAIEDAELEASNESGDAIARNINNKVFIVSNPANELQRILGSNSDVIGAVRAFLGNLDLIDQTENMISEINDILSQSPQASVLLEGPARPGKTIIAMSLLSKHPNAKTLLMNWFFYDALIDAFKIWGKLSEDEISKLFTTDPAVLTEVNRKMKKVRWLKDI